MKTYPQQKTTYDIIITGMADCPQPPTYREKVLAAEWARWHVEHAPVLPGSPPLHGSVEVSTTGRVVYTVERKTPGSLTEMSFDSHGKPIKGLDYTAQAYAWIDRERYLVGRTVEEAGKVLQNRCTVEALQVQLADLRRLLREADRVAQHMLELHYNPPLNDAT